MYDDRTSPPRKGDAHGERGGYADREIRSVSDVPKADERTYASPPPPMPPTRPLTYTPSDSRFYGANDFGDLVEEDAHPSDGMYTDPYSPASGMPGGPSVPRVPEPIREGTGEKQGMLGEPDEHKSEDVKEKENQMFKKLEQMMQPDNIEGMSKQLNEMGVDVPADSLKEVLPNLMPVLKKYGNRVLAGDDAEKFEKYDATASKITELVGDLQPLIGSIIKLVFAPKLDADGRVVLTPDDEKKFDNMEQDVDQGSLSAFLQDENAEGGSPEQTGVPNTYALPSEDPEPGSLNYEGRGGRGKSYAAPKDNSREQVPPEQRVESLAEIEARMRDEMGADVFDASMADSRRKESEMKARPMATSLADELKAAEAREADMRARPALEAMQDPAAEARNKDLNARPALGIQPSESEIAEAKKREADLNARPALKGPSPTPKNMEDARRDERFGSGASPARVGKTEKKKPVTLEEELETIAATEDMFTDDPNYSKDE